MDNLRVSHVSRYFQKLRGNSTEAVLTRKVGGAFVINSIGTFLAFVLQILLARMLGAIEFGQYMYATTWIMLLTVVCKCGLDTAALRLLPQYKWAGQLSLLRGYIRWSSILALFVSICVSLLLVLVVEVQNRIEQDLQIVFNLAAIVLPLSVHLALQGSRLQAFQHIAWSQLPQVVVRPLLLAGFVVLAAGMGHGKISAQGAMAAQIASTLACVLILLIGTRMVLPREVFRGVSVYDKGLWLGVAVPMVMITGFDMLLNQTDVLLVGSLLNTTEAGVYSAAAKITLLIPMAIIFVNTVTAPAIAQLHKEGQTVHLQRMLTRVAWGSMVVSIPLCIGIIVCSRWLLGLFGPQFESARMALVILTIGRLVVALTGSVGYLMSMSNHQREAAAILGATAVFNIILCSVLVPMLGIEGAALSTTISMTLWAVIMVAAAYRLTGINATVLPLAFLGRRLEE